MVWTANSEPDLAGYNVFRALSPGVPTGGTPLNGDDLVTGTAFTDATAANGTSYYYVVAAVDGSNNASGSSNEANATPVGAPATWFSSAPATSPTAAGRRMPTPLR